MRHHGPGDLDEALIGDGKLPAIKFGNKWLVEKSVLEQFASGYDGRPGNKATLF